MSERGRGGQGQWSGEGGLWSRRKMTRGEWVEKVLLPAVRKVAGSKNGVRFDSMKKLQDALAAEPPSTPHKPRLCRYCRQFGHFGDTCSLKDLSDRRAPTPEEPPR